jgi:Phage tail assembly chaperone protein, TAC
VFGEMAVRLCKFAAGELGWRPDEFWGSTPAELAACLPSDDQESVAPSADEMTSLREQFPDRGQP